MFTDTETKKLRQILVTYLSEGSENRVSDEIQSIADKLQLTDDDKQYILDVSGLVVE